MNDARSKALAALFKLLADDLDKVTWEQEKAAVADLRGHPSFFQLILAVKRWAAALADVCRSYAGRAAVIHASDQHEPATMAVGSILLILSEHLNLPKDATLFAERWPEPNAVREFVLQVSGVPVDIIDGDLVARATLPRWEPKSSLARKIARLDSDRTQRKKHSAFLSPDETREHLRGLQQSFRSVLCNKLGSSFSEAEIAAYLNTVLGSSRQEFAVAKMNVHGASHPRVDTNLMCGEWIEEMVKEGKLVAGSLRARANPNAARLNGPRFSAEILDVLSELDRNEFYKDARYLMRAEELLRWIGKVQGISSSRAGALRKDYRRMLREARKVSHLNPSKRTSNRTPKNNLKTTPKTV